MNMLTLIQQRRSCRIFEDKPIEPDKIDALTKAILWSPTSKNSRPWEFIWVDDKATISELAKCKPHGAEFLTGAPLALVIVADPQKSDVWVEDTAIAATLAQLTAEDLGLGSCWVQIRLRQHHAGITADEACKQLLHIPGHYQTASIIAIGYKQKERKPYADEQLLKEKIHLNKF
ncbi:MAG: nitroreductase family protein [Breznakibacter sp.]